VKSSRDAAARRPARSSTTAVRNSRHPIWNQTLVVEVLQEDLDRGDGAVAVAVINHDSKRRIAQVMVPVHRLVPSEQYNLDVPLGSGGASQRGSARLYISVTLHDSTMGEKTLLLANPHLTRLEVLIKGCAMGRPLPHASDETITVVRIVPNAAAYTTRIGQVICAPPHQRSVWTAGADKGCYGVRGWCYSCRLRWPAADRWHRRAP
jgi:hypothetical protein